MIDHLSLAQCAGFTGCSFTEVQRIWSNLQIQWAGAYGEVLRAVVDTINVNDVNVARGHLTLERTIKWKFVLPILLLRIPPSSTGTKARDLKLIVQHQLHQYDVGSWRSLVAELKADMIIAQTMHHVETRTQSDKDKFLIQKAADLLSRFQCSKSLKHLQSNGLGAIMRTPTSLTR